MAKKTGKKTRKKSPPKKAVFVVPSSKQGKYPQLELEFDAKNEKGKDGSSVYLYGDEIRSRQSDSSDTAWPIKGLSTEQGYLVGFASCGTGAIVATNVAQVNQLIDWLKLCISEGAIRP